MLSKEYDEWQNSINQLNLQIQELSKKPEMLKAKFSMDRKTKSGRVPNYNVKRSNPIDLYLAECRSDHGCSDTYAEFVQRSKADLSHFAAPSGTFFSGKRKDGAHSDEAASFTPSVTHLSQERSSAAFETTRVNATTYPSAVTLAFTDHAGQSCRREPPSKPRW